VSRLLIRRGVFRGGPFRGALGEDTTLTAAAPPVPVAVVDSPLIIKIDQQTQAIVRRLDDDVRARKYALMIGAASAVFAAVKLGIIAFPAIRSRVGR
jgi:hypothetical protein